MTSKPFKKLQEKHSKLIMAHIASIRHNVHLQNVIDDLEIQLAEVREIVMEQVEHIDL